MTLIELNLILKDEPLELVLALLNNCGQRLEAGKTKLEYIEEGGRPTEEETVGCVYEDSIYQTGLNSWEIFHVLSVELRSSYYNSRGMTRDKAIP